MESQLSTNEVTCKFCKDDMTPVTLALKVSEQCRLPHKL